jgi:hypothetical protein
VVKAVLWVLRSGVWKRVVEMPTRLVQAVGRRADRYRDRDRDRDRRDGRLLLEHRSV